MKYILMLSLYFAIVTTVNAKPYVYISVGGESKIVCYESSIKDGKLTHIEDIKTDSSPGAMRMRENLTVLFVALRRAKSVATYRVDSKTGKLTLIATKKVGVNPVYLYTSGKYLFLASYSEGKVGKFLLNDKGELLDEGTQWFDTERTAHAIKAGPDNKSFFVPHTRPNKIYQFQFDEKTGKLSRNKISNITAPEGAGPRHHCFHNNGKFVFTSDELGSSASAYTLDAKTGSLTHLQTLSTLPKVFDKKNTCADVELHPSQKFLYVSNRGHNSIAIFSVNQKTGKLTSLGQTATEDTPRSFNITPDGNFIHVAGQKSGKLATYRIDKSTGKMTHLRTIEVGKSPSWVEAVLLSRD